MTPEPTSDIPRAFRRQTLPQVLALRELPWRGDVLELPAPRRAPAPEPPPPPAPTSTRVLAGRTLAAYWAMAALWVLVCVRFWAWWLAPEHRGSTALYVPMSVGLAYLTTLLPSFYWFFLGRMRRPVHVPAPPGRRVAMITPCVPSHEALSIVETQLQALAAVRYPHDSWILDEGDDPRIQALADQYDVHYFSRHGFEEYNQPGPPFQAKTKAGNVNAWLDFVDDLGMEYEFFVQLDVDHHPEPEYLDRVLGGFEDPQVAWTQAPSVCRNLDDWTARGLAEQDVLLQGPLQMGFYGHSRTPFIIGSHTTYRTSAIQAIGGFQPTRAEDHLDTVVLAAEGHTGVYVPEIIARGDGPEDFSTYLGQQFAWAYSMIQIFVGYTPRLLRRYTPGQAFQFLMAQSWYTLWSLCLATLWLLPVVALLTQHRIAAVGLGEFLVFYLGVVVMSTAMWWWGRAWFQPAGVRLSWRGVTLEIARWPIVLWALVNVVFSVKRPYMITRKGDRLAQLPSAMSAYGPYLVLSWFGVATIWAFHLAIGRSPTEGYVGLVLFNTVMMMVPLLVACCLEQRDLRRRLGTAGALKARSGLLAVVAVLVAATVAAAIVVWASLGQAV